MSNCRPTQLIVVTRESSYQVAHSDLIRLEAEGFEEPMLSELAKESTLPRDAFKARFLPAVGASARFRRNASKLAKAPGS